MNYAFLRELMYGEYRELLAEIKGHGGQLMAVVARQGEVFSDEMRAFLEDANEHKIGLTKGVSAWPAVAETDFLGDLYWFAFVDGVIDAFVKYMPFQFNGTDDPIKKFFEDAFIQAGHVATYRLNDVIYSTNTRARVGILSSNAVSSVYLNSLIGSRTVVPEHIFVSQHLTCEDEGAA